MPALDHHNLRFNIIQTNKGPVYLHGPVEESFLKQLKLDAGLQNFRFPEAQHKALLEIVNFDDGLVFVAYKGSIVIGYVTFHHPEFPRWSNTGVSQLIELGGIEVSSSWRKLGIGRYLMEWIFKNYDFENKIVISINSACNWDLRDTDLSVWFYKKILEKVFTCVGFEERKTDDPEVIEHPANMLMVREGFKVRNDTKAEFKKLLRKGKSFLN